MDFQIIALPISRVRLFNPLFLFGVLILATLWGVWILARLQERKVWVLFLWILVLTQLFLYLGILKRLAQSGSVFERYCWYLTYGPLLFIPSLWFALVLVSFTDWDLKHILATLDVISGILFILLMSNDLHHWAFYPIVDAAGVFIRDGHGPLYFVIYAYLFLVLAASCLVLVVGTLHKRNQFRNFFPVFLILALLLVYSILYILPSRPIARIPVLNSYFVCDVVLGFALMESALRTGITQNSGRYRTYFKEGPYRLALYDKNYRPYLENDAFVFTPEVKEKDEVMVAGFRYRKKKQGDGYLLLQDDMRDVLRLQKELLSKGEELQKTTRMLEERQHLEAEIEQRKLRERLNDSLTIEIEKEAENLERIVASLPDELSPESRKECKGKLEELQNRLSFLKQRCLFLVNAQANATLKGEDFSLSLGSLVRDLENVGFSLAISYEKAKEIPLVYALRFNGFLRSVIEAFGPERSAIFLAFDPNKGTLKARFTPSKNFDRSHLAGLGALEEEDDELLFTVKGGSV